MLKMIENQKGMTLVELLAVMVIVGIIAAISVPAIGNLLENARKDQVIANAVSIQEAARLYVDAGDFSGTSVTADVLVTQGYLDVKPLDPKKATYTTATVTITTTGNRVSYTTELVSDNYTTPVVAAAKDAKLLVRTDITKK